MNQRYSAWTLPVCEGIYMLAASMDMAELQKCLPQKYVDIYVEDRLYNSDWKWHTIKNFDWLSDTSLYYLVMMLNP